MGSCIGLAEPVAVGIEGEALGLLALDDLLKPSAQVVAEFERLGVAREPGDFVVNIVSKLGDRGAVLSLGES